MTTECKRTFTKEEMITELKTGRLLRCDRRDAPELPELLELEREGLVTSRLVEIDEQYGYLEFRWKP